MRNKTSTGERKAARVVTMTTTPSPAPAAAKSRRRAIRSESGVEMSRSSHGITARQIGASLLLTFPSGGQ
jgi:hypothetical protein